MYKRAEYQILFDRLKEPRKFMQVVLGPRQVGKSTMVMQVTKNLDLPFLFFSADAVLDDQGTWISENWNTARRLLKAESVGAYVLIFDEIQKIKNWSEIVKKEWDYDTINDINIKVVLLGSSRVLLERGLSDSMMGRYEEIRMTHWSYPEMKDAFGFTLEQYLFYGGYPGAAHLINNHNRWTEYIKNSIVDATINKDILNNSQIYKPALLRQTFELATAYSGQILSLTKLLGQLQSAGNVTTVANYLDLLNQCGLIAALYKYANDEARRRQSPPKYQVYNNALMSAVGGLKFENAIADAKIWGRIYGSAVGAHIINCAFKYNFDVYYWRENKYEVDFVIVKDRRIGGFEAKSNNEAITEGMVQFRLKFNPEICVVVGNTGITIDKFLSINPADLIS